MAGNVAQLNLTSSAISTRGVVLTPHDLSGMLDWPELASAAGLTTIATHGGPGDVVQFLESVAGRRFLADCARFGLEVEHELHAMSELLPRELFDDKPEYFRMDASGRRVREQNCCASSAEAVATIAANAVDVAKKCRSTTSRYYFWLDDGSDVCHCPKCSRLNAADQALIIENAIVKALRRHVDPNATLAHLAYGVTMTVPENIMPDKGIFLEFADMGRERCAGLAGAQTAIAKRLLDVFPRETAQVLEYWLDVSFFSKWRTPHVKLPWNEELFRRDVAQYAELGFRKFTSFAVWLDDSYIRKYGKIEEIGEYGRGLLLYVDDAR